MAKGLTKRQQAILDYIISCIRDHGYPPTIAEVGAEFGITSTNGVNDHLVALEKKGYIERSSKARGIVVTSKAVTGLYQTDFSTAPLVGRVAAGSPILAEENIEDHIPIPASQAKGVIYALTVSGDSMIEDGIHDGDVIIVNQDRRARTNDIVVALVGDEATVKRFHPQGSTIELRPANSEMQPMRYHAADVQLQGVVVGLQRTYN